MEFTRDLRTVNWASEFYVGRLVRAGGRQELECITTDNHGRPKIGWSLATEVKISGVVFAGNPDFLLEGQLFDLFIEHGTRIVDRQRSEQFKNEYAFMSFGERWIELTTTQYGNPCVVESFAVAEVWLDHRERLVSALNEVVRATRPLTQDSNPT